MASWARFGPRPVVEKPWCNKNDYETSNQLLSAGLEYSTSTFTLHTIVKTNVQDRGE